MAGGVPSGVEHETSTWAVVTPGSSGLLCRVVFFSTLAHRYGHFANRNAARGGPSWGGQKVLGDQKEPQGLTRGTPRPSLPFPSLQWFVFSPLASSTTRAVEGAGGTGRAQGTPVPTPPPPCPAPGQSSPQGLVPTSMLLPPLSPLLVPRPRSHQRYAQGDGGCVHGLAGDSPRCAGCRPGLAPRLPALSGRSGSTRGFGEPSLSKPAVGWGSLGRLSLGREPERALSPTEQQEGTNPFPTGEAGAQQDLPRDWGWGRLAGRGLSRPLLCKKP